jgi:hypothetical protein
MEYNEHKDNILRSVLVNDADVNLFQDSLEFMLQHHPIKEISTWKVGRDEVFSQNFLLHACLEVGMTDSTTSIALALIHAGFDVNLENIEGYTPMSLAIRKGDISVIRAMVARGANVHTLVGDLSYLDRALELHRYDVCQLLLNAGFDINAPNTYTSTFGRNGIPSISDISGNLREGFTNSNALFYALDCLDLEQVEFLLDLGANPNQTAIRLSAIPTMRDRSPAQRLEFSSWLNLSRICTITPLYVSVLLQQTEKTRLLLDHGADPNFTSNSGESLCGLLDITIKQKFKPSVDVSAFALLFNYGLQVFVRRKTTTWPNTWENLAYRGGGFVFEAHEDTSDDHNISRLIRTKVKEKRCQALAMALHDRLGANAELRGLGVDMIRDIAYMNSD